MNGVSVIQSVDRAIRVLRVLAEQRKPLTALELSRVVELDRSTVHRLLTSLENSNMVTKDGSSWSTGPGSLFLGQAFIDQSNLRKVALPFAVDLLTKTVRHRPWTVSLSIPLFSYVVILDRVWGQNAPLEAMLSIGTVLPIDGSANGMAILAWYGDDTLQGLLAPERVVEITPDLKEIRDRHGLAFGTGEVRAGLSGLSIALRNGDGTPIASLTVAGYEIESEMKDDSESALRLVEIANQLRNGRF